MVGECPPGFWFVRREGSRSEACEARGEVLIVCEIRYRLIETIDEPTCNYFHNSFRVFVSVQLYGWVVVMEVLGSVCDFAIALGR